MGFIKPPRSWPNVTAAGTAGGVPGRRSGHLAPRAGGREPRWGVPVRACARRGGLVLDGLLQVEGPAGFVGGPAAADLLLADPAAAEETALGAASSAALSRAALAHAAALDLTEAADLSARLYFFNRRPLTPAWK